MTEDDNVIHVDFGARSKPKPEPTTSPSDSKDVRTPSSQTPISIESEKKIRFFEQAIAEGTVLVTLDARREGVQVPEQFREYLNLSLNFDYRYNISDFSFDDQGVRASLSFNGVDSWCDIPWDAIYGIRNQSTTEVEIFTLSLPPELQHR